MSNLLFKISHFTGKTTRILSALQELFPSSDGFDLKFRLDLRFRWKVLKSYIFKMPRTFLWNNYFLSNLCILICHWTGKCLWSFASFSENPEETDPPRSTSIPRVVSPPTIWSKETPPPWGVSYLLCSLDQEPRGRGPPSKNLYQVLRGGSSSSGFLIREYSK